MNKKIKYVILIVLIIVLAIIAYLFISNKPAKTEPVEVILTKEQMIEKATKENQTLQEENNAKIQQIREEVDLKVKEDLARRAQEGLLATSTATSTDTVTVIATSSINTIDIKK